MENTARIVDFGHRHPTEYRRLKPSAGLRDIVESIWVQQEFVGPARTEPSCVVPTGTVEILFQYGDLIGHREKNVFREMPRSYVTGQRSRPVQVVSAGQVGIILVSLYPWGLAPLFPGSLEAPDGYTDLRLLIGGRVVERLEEALSLAPSTGARIGLIEEFLLRIRRPSLDQRMVLAARVMSSAEPEQTFAQSARALAMSERHLSRSFKAAVGLRPGMFMRVMRFQRAMSLRRRTGMPWADLALSCGYADQSHLIHEVRRFTGRSPGRIVLEGQPSNSTFNGDGVSRFFDTVYVS